MKILWNILNFYKLQIPDCAVFVLIKRPVIFKFALKKRKLVNKLLILINIYRFYEKFAYVKDIKG